MYTQVEIRKVQRRLLEMAVNVRDILEKYEYPHMLTYGSLLGAVRHKGFIPWDDDFDFYIIGEHYNEAMEHLRKEFPQDIFLEDEKSEPLYFHGWAHAKDLNTEAECDLFPQDNLYAHKGISIDLYRAYNIKSKYDRINRLKAHLDYLDRKKNKGLISDDDYNNQTGKLSSELKEEELKVIDVDWEKDDDMVGFISIHNDSMLSKDIFPLVKYDFEGTYFWGPKNADVMLRCCYGDYMQFPPEEKRKPHYSSVKFL